MLEFVVEELESRAAEGRVPGLSTVLIDQLRQQVSASVATLPSRQVGKGEPGNSSGTRLGGTPLESRRCVLHRTGGQYQSKLLADLRSMASS